METVGLEKVVEEDEAELKRLIENHVNYTGSTVGQRVLDNWEAALYSLKSYAHRLQARPRTAARQLKRPRGRRALLVRVPSNGRLNSADCFGSRTNDGTRNMGKPTGFKEFEREAAPYRDPVARVSDFDEIYTTHNLDRLTTQGARCMDCGVLSVSPRMDVHP